MRILIRCWLLWCSLSLLGSLSAQPHFWIELRDKAGTAQLRPTDLLSPRALQRRARQGIRLDQHDYPVSPRYHQQLQQLGIACGVRSRWLNAIAAPLTPEQQARVLALPFVKRLRPLRYHSQVAAPQQTCPDSAEWHHPQRQLEMLDLDVLHRNGLTGRGVLVAVFDNGFDGVDQLPGFDHLFAEGRILGTRDYVDGDHDVYHSCSHCRHGTYVFSILAAVMPGQLIGAAPGASYLLLRTEDDASETPQEEANWVAAAEYADSMGADIFTTSLGYRDFDGQQHDYSELDLDGNTATITRAADRAASRGILVVNSAGNSGGQGLNAPADGDSVLSVGAVDGCGRYASFSSQGPTADGRLKPELTAMGRGNYFLHPNGNVYRGNGTSYSCPLISGLAACLWQRFPQTSSQELTRILQQSATQAQTPDFRLGHGIPSGLTAWERLQTAFPQVVDSPLQTDVARYDPFRQSTLAVFPNPASGQVYLSLLVEINVSRLRLQWVDLMGQALPAEEVAINEMGNPHRLAAPALPGVYLLRVMNAENDDLLYLRKVIIQP